MKNKGQRKLSFDKIKIAKLSNQQVIVGGFFVGTPGVVENDTETTTIPPQTNNNCISIKGGGCGTSTKTGNPKYSAYCFM